MTSSNKKLQTNLDYLFKDLHVYDDEQGRHPNGPRRWAKKQLEQFQHRQKNRTSLRVELNYHQLIAKARHSKLQLNKAEHDAMLAAGHTSFAIYPSSPEHLEIRDRKGVLLAYRFRMPPELLAKLTASESLLPPRCKKKHARGSTINRHYGVWKKYMDDP